MLAVRLDLTAICVVLALFALAAEGQQQYIRPGGPTTPHWNDTDGNRIEAHAAGMFLANDGRWYWYGESQKTDDLSTHGVNCYSSKSLQGPWTFEGQVLSQSDITGTGISGPYVVERPKVLYNNKTGNYVMWFHLDDSNYQYRHAAIAVSSTPNGHFRFVRSFQPDGIPSLDMSLFKDPVDGTAYFIRSCDNQYAGISRLSDDYMNTTGIISTHDVFEGMAIFRHPNGTYYIICSHLTGWNPNPLMLYRAAGKTLDDPQWVDMGNPTGDPTSFNTQPTYVVSMYAADGSQYFMYMADNWVHGGPNGLIDASYVWLPMKFNPDNVTISWAWEWDPLHPFDPIPCQPATLGSQLALTACNGSDPSQRWVAAVGSPSPIQLAANPRLCVVPSNTTSSIVLGNCDGSSSQQFTYDPTSGRFSHASDGTCIDVTYCSDSFCPGDYLETYACNTAHNNQEFTYDPAAGLILSQADTRLCVTAATC